MRGSLLILGGHGIKVLLTRLRSLNLGTVISLCPAAAFIDSQRTSREQSDAQPSPLTKRYLAPRSINHNLPRIYFSVESTMFYPPLSLSIGLPENLLVEIYAKRRREVARRPERRAVSRASIRVRVRVRTHVFVEARVSIAH